MAERSTEIAPREQFGMFDRFAAEMERLFDDFGFGRRSVGRPWRGSWSGSGLTGHALWAPDIEVYHRDNQLVVRADLPGLKKDDITIDVTDDAITISGERRQEQQTDREGIYRSERSYGSFFRTIPLPDGAISDQAKASFKDGVLEITLPAPPQSTRGRRVEISDGTGEKHTRK